MSKTEIQNFIRGQFEGVLDDDYPDVESETVVSLQEEFGLTQEESEEELKKFFK